nr:unnamed protein product [Callosobruchus analis]
MGKTCSFFGTPCLRRF